MKWTAVCVLTALVTGLHSFYEFMRYEFMRMVI
jgi:hypothetical protein